MSARSGALLIDWQQAMPPDSPAMELEVVGSSTPSVTPCPAAAARADADIDRGGCAAEFYFLTDRELQERIRKWEGPMQAILRRTPDGGHKMQSQLLRMKEELERRMAARQRKDDTVLRQAVQAKRSRGEISNLKSDDETMDIMASKYHLDSSYTTSTKTYTEVNGAVYKERSSLSHGKCAYPKNGGQISKELLSPQQKTCAHLPKSRTINQQENSTVNKRTNATFGTNRRWNLAKNKALPSLKIKKDVVLLDDDDDDDTEPARSADVQISNKWDESKIHYPSTDPEAVGLSYSDMKCLEPEEYLNSPVINFYLQYLKKSRPHRDLYMFNTYFYSKLEEALSTPGDHDSKLNKLRRWWRSVDIFKKAYIILPINESKHWSLIIVCMPTKEADSGPIILHLDSLVGIHASGKLFDIVRRYLEAEWRHLQKDSSYDIPFSERIWKRLSKNIIEERVKVPRQQNDYDCGLFMLYYIDRFIQEAPERMTKQGLGMFVRGWFDPKEASALREGIRALLFDLFHNALDDDGPSEPDLHPGEDKDIWMA